MREGGVDGLGRACTAELSNEEGRMGAVARRRRSLRIGPSLSAAFVLSPRISNSTSGGAAALCDLACVGRIERRADVLHGRDLREAGDDVVDGGIEGSGAPACSRAALDQHALTRGHLESGIEDPVHAAGLAGAGLIRIRLLHADLASDGEREQHEREPAEGGGLPVGRAPAAHAGSQIAAIAVRGAEHDGSPFGGSCGHGMSTSLTLVAVVRRAT